MRDETLSQLMLALKRHRTLQHPQRMRGRRPRPAATSYYRNASALRGDRRGGRGCQLGRAWLM